jgi:hypothetical protein
MRNRTSAASWFDEYFVVPPPATARRYRDHVLPGETLVDEAALERIFTRWTVDVGSGIFSAPTLIAAGRRKFERRVHRRDRSA